MKKIFFLSLLISVSSAYLFFAYQPQQQKPEKAIAQLLLAQVDSFAASCKALQTASENAPADEKQLQQLFLETRLKYKSIEWAAEYFEPATSRAVNGAPVQEAEPSGLVLEPAGLQVIETFLFPAYDTIKKAALLQQLALLQQRCAKYKTHFGNIELFDWQVFDAVKLEVFRIETLGITGFDNPLTLQSMRESATSLKSVQQVLAFYNGEESNGKTEINFDAATAYLTNHPDFNSFDRAAFITTCCNPITTEITNLENSLHLPVIRYNRLLNQDAKTLFDTGAFNVNAYSPDPSSFVTAAKIALGKKLFQNPMLSGNGSRSCQSCHQPEKAFTDGLDKNIAISNNQRLKRNTPTLLNAAFQPAQFYDLRVNTLENQSLDVVQSTVEMHGSLKLAVEKLWNDATYRKLFSKAFPKAARNGIDTFEVMNAISSYVRSLISLNSRFDAYMRGDKTAMTNDEVNGFNLFMGKAKCATCHYMPLFNGTFPPRYIKTEAEVLGIPQSVANKKVDSDLGQYGVLKMAWLKHAFKTPSLRNAARTAPYMHNGVFGTLAQVVGFYNNGGGTGIGIKVENQTLPSAKLNLTDTEQKALIAFIKSLDGR